MSNIGFVYILVNEFMPGVYKVGCTERSPHTRADELSKHTGVPAPFEVLCYIECHDFQTVEKKFHGWLSEWRISTGREFFNGNIDFAIRLMWWYRGRLSFVAPERNPFEDEFWNLYPHLAGSGVSMRSTVDPWATGPVATVKQAVEKVIDDAATAADAAALEMALKDADL